MTHATVVWRDTPGDRTIYGTGDTRRMEFSFYGYYKLTGAVVPPATSLAAITAAETAGANLRIDGEYVGPTGTYTPSGYWILAGLTVERLPDTNEQSDVVWMFRVTLESAFQSSTDEPFVTCTTQAGSVNVSAFRMNPTIPTDMTTPASDEYLASNDSIWHAVTDIAGKPVDWNGNPIQYALPLLTTTLTIQRPAPIWLDGGTRDTGAIGVVSSDSALIGYRNSEDMGFIGDAGQVLLAGVSCSALNNGMYNISYTFRRHPWKHAIQTPRVVGSAFKQDVNANNAERVHNEYIWWSQPHLLGADFLCDLNITTDEWAAIGLTVSC